MGKKHREARVFVRNTKKLVRKTKVGKVKKKKEAVSLHCVFCDKTFATKWTKKKHDISFHSDNNTPLSKPRCFMCGKNFDEQKQLVEHYFSTHDTPTDYALKNSALKNSFSQYSKNFNADVDPFNESSNPLAIICDEKHHNEISSVLNKHLQTCSPSFKASLCINGLFERVGDEDSSPISLPFRSEMSLITPKTDMTSQIHQWLKSVDKNLEAITAKGSGYSLTKVQYSQILISNCKSLDTVGHSTSLDLSSIRNHSQLINLKNSPQDQCYLGALAAAMMYKDILKHNKIVRQRRKSKSGTIDALDHNNKVYSAFIDRLDLTGVQVNWFS